MTIKMTRKDVLAKLNEKLALARAEDEKAMAAHRKEEEKALREFRVKLHQAMKWDYKKAKSNYFRISFSGPSCPHRQAARIERVVTAVKLDSREEFHLREGNDVLAAINWLPDAMREKQTICD